MDSAIESSADLPVVDTRMSCGHVEKLCFEADLLGALGQAVVATDVYGRIVYWNSAAETLFGWSSSDTVGKNVVEFFDTALLERNPEVLKRIRAGKPWTGEVTVRRHDGQFLATILANRPVFDGKKKLCGVVGVFTDVSNLKWMQEVMEEAVKAVTELNEKLRVVESLTRHDIRNKLSAINGRVYLLKKQLVNNPDFVGQVKEIESASSQILRILEFEQVYVQVGSEELTEVDVGKYVDEAVTLFSSLKRVEAINSCHGLRVIADSLLRQLFYNLIDNTLKYGEKVSQIRIYFEETKNHLKLIYEDNGVGIPEEMKELLFTEGYGRGTGYGLYLIKRICEAYGWSIQETGKRGLGAKFVMTAQKKGKKDKLNNRIVSSNE
ncbi:MAG: PAS domain S-box protein [Candidatus Bathyarchaeota archaeon]|nr:PAS domain S-box protein [Candidatus Bathyarchaeota archaeon]